uniref:Uncharacterized protein n=1 Tax=Anguilla anguilla TaxID=7936 RepID=A0A0E9VYK8_ANGAN
MSLCPHMNPFMSFMPTHESTVCYCGKNA